MRSNPAFSLVDPENWISPAHLKCFLERIPSITEYSDTSNSRASAVQSLPTDDSFRSMQLYTPQCDFSDIFMTRTAAWVTHISAPIPRMATSVAQLESCLWELPSDN